MSNVTEWKSIVNAISQMTEDAIFICTKDGVTFRGIDNAKMALLDVSFPKSSFDNLVATNSHFGLKINDLKTALNFASENDQVEFHVPKKTIMFVSITGSLSMEYSIKLIQRKKPTLPLPEIKYKSRLTFESDALTRIVSNIHQISEFIKIQCSSKHVIFSGEGKLGDARINLDKKSPSLKLIKSKGNSSATYSLEYMVKVIREIGKASKQIDVSYSNENPVQLTFDMPSLTKVSYYVAPQTS